MTVILTQYAELETNIHSLTNLVSLFLH